MAYCSSGYNRILIQQNGKIFRCFSKINPISDIYNFSFADRQIEECSGQNCILCDKTFVQFTNDKSTITQNHLDIQFSPTSLCKNYCPYCRCSDYPYVNDMIPIEEFIKFFNKIPPTLIVLIGGEPLCHPDLYKLFDSKHHFLLYTSLMPDNQIPKLVSKNLSIAATCHPYAKNFNWDRFWENIEIILKNGTNIATIRMIDFRIDKIKNVFLQKCRKFGIKAEISPVDYSMASPRTNNHYDELVISEKKFDKL